jgi:hypothetical protein
LAKPGSVEEGRLLRLIAFKDFVRTYDYAAACRLLEQALDAARRYKDRVLEMHAMSDWAQMASLIGSPEDAIPRIHRALELLREIDDPITEYFVRFRAYHLALSTGDLATARAHAQGQYAVAARLRSAHHMGLALLVVRADRVGVGDRGLDGHASSERSGARCGRRSGDLPSAPLRASVDGAGAGQHGSRKAVSRSLFS